MATSTLASAALMSRVVGPCSSSARQPLASSAPFSVVNSSSTCTPTGLCHRSLMARRAAPTPSRRSPTPVRAQVPGSDGSQGQEPGNSAEEAGEASASADVGKVEPVVQEAATIERNRIIEEQQGRGIFGTSGNFGFTKANELFVGRMAMLGFAAALTGEALTSSGPLAQFCAETGVPFAVAPSLLAGFIAFTLLGAFTFGLGNQGRLEADMFQPARSRSLRGMFGLAEAGPFFGFTRPNEVFVGRLAQLGFISAVIGELWVGGGPLEQLHLETGAPVFALQSSLAVFTLLTLGLSLNLGAGRFVNDKDIKTY